MIITWIGHSCVKIEEDGYALVIDPYGIDTVPGLLPVKEKANKVLCSHEHSDHNYREGIEIVESDGTPFEVTTINSYHDDAKGSLRGSNIIHIISDGNEKIAHLGDLGCILEAVQIDMLKNIDVLLIPIGGYYTIDAKKAYELCNKINPKLIIPLHFRDDELGFGYDVISTKGEFVELMKDVKIVDSCSIDTKDNLDAKVIVLRPQNN